MATTTSSVFGYSGSSRPEFRGKTVEERRVEQESRNAQILSDAADLGIVTPEHLELRQSHDELKRSFDILESKMSAVRDFLDGNLTKASLRLVVDSSDYETLA